MAGNGAYGEFPGWTDKKMRMVKRFEKGLDCWYRFSID
jgi:hypothetical protein